MMDDLISRQAAIDAIAGCTNCGDEEQLRKYVVKHGLENGWTGGVLDALDAIYELPSAQPEKRTEKRTETHARDSISRQAAQRLFGKALTYKERNGKLTWTTSEFKQWLADCTEQLPHAQPEPCEDAVSRYSANYYSERLKNDEHKAVEILDVFTKAFCIDAEAGNDLVFRCPECLFKTIDGTCLVKAFKHKFDPDYKDFGSMGDL
jgi:hypothetical protein